MYRRRRRVGAAPTTASTHRRTTIGTANKSNNVLCLGMSYPCVQTQMEQEGVDWNHLDNKNPSVEQTVELVRRKVLTEMDGRDLARCISMEELLSNNNNNNNIDTTTTRAYTVSQENGAAYDPTRHLTANFNRQTFLREIKQAWGPTIRFRQVILDYFWIPTGSWMMNHWGRSFFQTTLPGFVKEGLLEFENNTNNNHNKKSKTNKTAVSSSSSGIGVVYLPFCFHCVKHIVASMEILSEYYTISFVYKHELEEHALWHGTSKICPNVMQEWLGKQLDQEELYCTFTPQDVKECIEDAHVTKEEVVDVLRQIEDFTNVRMIRLKPLRKHDPSRRARRQTASTKYQTASQVGIDVGGFVGLKPPQDIQNGYDDFC